MATLMETMARDLPRDEIMTEDDDLEMLEADVKSFENSLAQALLDPLNQQGVNNLYLSSMKILPHIAVSHAQSSARNTALPRTPRESHRHFLLDRLFLLLLALHHPNCSLGKSNQKLKSSSTTTTSNKSTDRALPRDWVLGILAESMRDE
ncbi:hypothetical protein PCANC_13519 [Puccinia coronata f. sp. avenae]|uniref:Uncharacterized protein n=1 Tax=Puccinia coronata f. sp. avenae TaxID=200324 RepID=A0A2N5USQ4_9BASI|nr:hypothetical protein PCANC_13519 [Puccinia coronata f. sp. avenae]